MNKIDFVRMFSSHKFNQKWNSKYVCVVDKNTEYYLI